MTVQEYGGRERLGGIGREVENDRHPLLYKSWPLVTGNVNITKVKLA